MNNTAKQVSQTAGGLAKNVVKNTFEEPLEILKESGRQIAGIPSPDADQAAPKLQENNLAEGHANDEVRSNRLIGALQREIEDIKKQDLIKELQAKISRGDEVPLSDYNELTIEEKQVLKAHMEAYKVQKSQSENRHLQEVPVVRSKPNRRFGAGQKHEAEKQQTRVEKPIPPSG